ncbi:hypothetical protein BDQ12DRAFT_667882 [Crucibulum laeve]|uniref:Uncharacterized protein n=1 Tax=Crucibulum laeve TaxID=68775 RepID=A0A5C3LTN0_9AGAR|nr:hypothetical protein BDQ12DRAFT_667882 [Crucibulum laeve]
MNWEGAGELMNYNMNYEMKLLVRALEEKYENKEKKKGEKKNSEKNIDTAQGPYKPVGTNQRSKNPESSMIAISAVDRHVWATATLLQKDDKISRIRRHRGNPLPMRSAKGGRISRSHRHGISGERTETVALEVEVIPGDEKRLIAVPHNHNHHQLQKQEDNGNHKYDGRKMQMTAYNAMLGSPSWWNIITREGRYRERLQRRAMIPELRRVPLQIAGLDAVSLAWGVRMPVVRGGSVALRLLVVVMLKMGQDSCPSLHRPRTDPPCYPLVCRKPESRESEFSSFVREKSRQEEWDQSRRGYEAKVKKEGVFIFHHGKNLPGGRHTREKTRRDDTMFLKHCRTPMNAPKVQGRYTSGSQASPNHKITIGVDPCRMKALEVLNTLMEHYHPFDHRSARSYICNAAHDYFGRKSPIVRTELAPTGGDVEDQYAHAIKKRAKELRSRREGFSKKGYSVTPALVHDAVQYQNVYLEKATRRRRRYTNGLCYGEHGTREHTGEECATAADPTQLSLNGGGEAGWHKKLCRLTTGVKIVALSSSLHFW